ncbi:hypothetical protein EJB05_36063, partial [Eragrostis curvula]
MKLPSTGHGEDEEMRSSEFLLYDLITLRDATDNFSEENKLGEGGFGPVYKGALQDGQEIAVKRLSTTSQQGQMEMKNEVVLVAKLQHKNLVRVLGCCIQEHERLLVYEFLINNSLDKILFDPARQQELSWEQRHKIIEGVGRGLLYLHEDSRLTIIHRDLKASNILLDKNMNPKISECSAAPAATFPARDMSILLTLLLLCSLILTAPANAGPISDCPSNTNYTRGSAFQANLDALLSSLPGAADASSGFAKNVKSAAPDQAYGLAQCRADVNASECRACLDALVQDMATMCTAGQKSAMLVYDFCLLRHSNASFFSAVDTSVVKYWWNPKTQNATELSQFTWTVGTLMSNLTAKAAYASPRMFAAGSVVLTPSVNIYGLAQCTRDLAADDCYRCLTTAVGAIPNFCNGKQGGQVIYRTCSIRFEVYSFYNARAAEAAMSLAPSPGGGPINGSNHSVPGSASGSRSPPGNTVVGAASNRTVRTSLLVAIPVTWALLVMLVVALCLCKRKRKAHKHVHIASVKFLMYDLSTLRDATNNFSEENKLGEGGFGLVYKGVLQDGQEIAVKRLSTTSQQGHMEMKNEVILVAKLQHRNLVRLLGCCIEKHERLLVYEFLSKKAWTKSFMLELSWEQRYKVIYGIGRGLMYLHEDSRMTIIHRDLKPGNILLDADMNPKISDFGLAKLFNIDDLNIANTNHVVGTRGYMAPEYVYQGIFSTKSDVFSYGVLVLEIITGRRPYEDLLKFVSWNHRIRTRYNIQSVLLASCRNGELTPIMHGWYGQVWRHWSKANMQPLLDGCPPNDHGKQEMLRCIHIGLLCVQDDPQLRPRMASIVLMLNSHSVALAVPTEPVFTVPGEKMRVAAPEPSVNEASISHLEPHTGGITIAVAMFAFTGLSRVAQQCSATPVATFRWRRVLTSRPPPLLAHPRRTGHSRRRPNLRQLFEQHELNALLSSLPHAAGPAAPSGFLDGQHHAKYRELEELGGLLWSAQAKVLDARPICILSQTRAAQKKKEAQQCSEAPAATFPAPDMSSLLTLLLLLLLRSLILTDLTVPANAGPNFIDCPSNTNYTRGSAFQANLDALLSSLPAAAAASSGFAENVTGTAPDQAYGLAQCRGDASASQCRACLDASAKDMARKCTAGQKSAMLGYDLCLLRHSNTSFFGALDTSVVRCWWSPKTLNATQPAQFTSALGALMRNLTAKAAYASPRMFAAGSVPSVNIYGMAQCTRDLAADDCNRCLAAAVTLIPTCCNDKQGGHVVYRSCSIRFDVYPFYSVRAAEWAMSPAGGPINGDAPLVPGRTDAATGVGSNGTVKTALLVSVPLAVTLLVLLFVVVYIFNKNRKQHKNVQIASNSHVDDEMGSPDSLRYDLNTLRAATDNFSEQNKLGQGGFGPVYKGTLQNEQIIAVKRLSTTSQQGQEEMKNEVVLGSKLQHKNLVRLLGYCIEQHERLLVYEFLSNKSLDKLLYGPTRQQELSWSQRYKIIEGISRGLLYLHEDSRLKIIHRDLKPANILLDADMNPKISDFGLAKLFNIDSSVKNTSHRAGTYGYMAPEYIMQGIVSAKSDVFSYGVLVLEIITRRRPDEDLIKF